MIYGCLPSELKRRVSSRELTELIAAERLGLLPDPWQQTGVIASTIANVNSLNKRPFQPDDFIPKLKPKRDIDGEMLKELEVRRGRYKN